MSSIVNPGAAASVTNVKPTEEKSSEKTESSEDTSNANPLSTSEESEHVFVNPVVTEDKRTVTPEVKETEPKN